MPTREGTPKKKRGAQDFVWMLAILGVIFAVILGRQEYKIYQINKEAEATRLRVEQLQRVQADLEAERKRLYDPKYIEKLAREDHNYVKKDEVPIFIVKDKDKPMFSAIISSPCAPYAPLCQTIFPATATAGLPAK